MKRIDLPMSKDLNTPDSPAAAVQNGNEDVRLQDAQGLDLPAAANSNDPEIAAEELAEVYFALG